MEFRIKMKRLVLDLISCAMILREPLNAGRRDKFTYMRRLFFIFILFLAGCLCLYLFMDPRLISPGCIFSPHRETNYVLKDSDPEVKIDAKCNRGIYFGSIRLLLTIECTTRREIGRSVCAEPYGLRLYFIDESLRYRKVVINSLLIEMPDGNKINPNQSLPATIPILQMEEAGTTTGHGSLLAGTYKFSPKDSETVFVTIQMKMIATDSVFDQTVKATFKPVVTEDDYFCS